MVKEWFSTNKKTFNRSNSDKQNDAGDAFLGIQRKNSTELDNMHKNSEPLKLVDSENNKLIGSGVLKYSGSSMGCVRILYFDFDVKVAIRDSKLKLEITNFNYTHYNQMTLKQTQMNGWSDNGLCNSKNTIENLLKCERCKGEFEKFYTYLSNDVLKISDSLKQYLKESKSVDEKW